VIEVVVLLSMVVLSFGIIFGLIVWTGIKADKERTKKRFEEIYNQNNEDL
jgi:hypothetical protein